MGQSTSCRSPGKREVSTQVFVVEVVRGADEELTVAVLGMGRGKRESKTEMPFPGAVTCTHCRRGYSGSCIMVSAGDWLQEDLKGSHTAWVG